MTKSTTLPLSLFSFFFFYFVIHLNLNPFFTFPYLCAILFKFKIFIGTSCQNIDSSWLHSLCSQWTCVPFRFLRTSKAGGLRILSKYLVYENSMKYVYVLICESPVIYIINVCIRNVFSTSGERGNHISNFIFNRAKANKNNCWVFNIINEN